MWGCDCYSTFRRRSSGCGLRCPRLGRAGCRPGGALTSPPCSAPVPHPPFTLPLSVEPTCCSRKAHARQHAQIPPCRPLLRASTLPSPPPLGRVCTTAEARGAKAASPGFGCGGGGFGAGSRDETVDDFSFSCLAFPSNKTFKSHECCFRFPFPTPPKPQAVKLNALFDEFHFEFHVKVFLFDLL